MPPADDLPDPSPATTFAHLDATVVLSRDIAALGHEAAPHLSCIGSTRESIAELLGIDLELNAQGMGIWLDRA